MGLFDEIKKYMSVGSQNDGNGEHSAVDPRYDDAIADDKWYDYLKRFQLDTEDFETFKKVQRLCTDDYDFEGTVRQTDKVFGRLGEGDLGKALIPYYADANLKIAELKESKRKACAELAINFYLKVLDIMPDNKFAKLNISRAYLLTEQYLVARNWLLPLFKTNLEERAKTLYRDNADQMRAAKLMDVPFGARKHLLVVNDEDVLAAFYNKPIPGFNYCFTLFDKPQDVKFSPEMSGAFVAHPKLTDNYIEMKRYEIVVLEKKMEDLKQFFRSAGATYYRISCNQKENFDVLTGLGFRLGSSALLNQNTADGTLRSEEKICFIEEHLRSAVSPCMDGNLVWRDEWLPLWKSREKGEVSLHYKLKLNDGEKILPKERADIKAYFETKEQKINGDILCYYFPDEESTNNIELDVVAYFKPLTECIDASISLTEKEYKKAVAECLSDDGSISDKERLFLEIRRKSLNIDEKRAQQIEEVCLQEQFTPNEREYMQLYRGMLELGIDDKALALLNKCVSDYGISDARRRLIERAVG